MLKVIRDDFGFALLRRVTKTENSRHFRNETISKLKPNATKVCPFFCASGTLLVFMLSYNWLLVIFSFLLPDGCDWFGFGFPTLGRTTPNSLPSVIGSQISHYFANNQEQNHNQSRFCGRSWFRKILVASLASWLVACASCTSRVMSETNFRKIVS